MQRGAAMTELWNERVLRPGAVFVTNVLTVDEKLGGVLTWIHGTDMVVNESLDRVYRWVGVDVHGVLTSRGVRRACEAPACPCFLGELGLGNICNKVSCMKLRE